MCIRDRLRPVDLADYPVTFTAAQQTRLMAAFPDGVCDYSLPAVQQQPPAGAWLVY